MQLHLGTSGWQYRDWRGRFYPRELAQARWLDFYAQQFATVEVNNSFYRLPSAETFTSWRARTPDDFRFVVKASRYLSHVLRLRDPEDPVDLLVDRARSLGDKLGPVLLQLPPTMAAEPERLRRTLGRFGHHRVRVAVEFRHETWFVDEVYGILRDHGAALVLSDRSNRHSPQVGTADWTFVRFHEGTASPWPRYGDTALHHWVETVAALDVGEAWTFFNNDPGCWAVENARMFGRFAARRGLHVTRYPAGPVRAAA